MNARRKLDVHWPGSRWRIALWSAAVLVLLLPAIAMRFTHEVKWDREDFLIMGAMLIAACGAFELALRATASAGYRLLFGSAIAVVFMLIWVHLAVGLF